VFGQSPAGSARTDVLAAVLASRRGPTDADRTLVSALASDLGLALDAGTAPRAESWTGPRPAVLVDGHPGPWRTTGDTIERLHTVVRKLIDGSMDCDPAWRSTAKILADTLPPLAAALDSSGTNETRGLLRGLAGRFVEPGPSGAPTRGRPDVLPTGRNFYSLDTRTVPTPAAWEIGKANADLLLERYYQEHGDWPRALALSAWGTANMRTGGDDIAQAMALMGARPTWEPSTRRVTGFEIVPLAKLGRPRVDVTLKISGFFRDAFPMQIDLIDSIVKGLAARDEPDEENPIAVRARTDAARLRDAGASPEQARRRSTYRVFGSAPGAYGAGLGTLIETGAWETEGELAHVFTQWGKYAYGSDSEGVSARAEFSRTLASIDAVVHNQDNREHDILDSDDYWQFAGGLAVAARVAQGRKLPVYHGDTSSGDRPVVRKLDEEIARVVRARAANPKWIEAMMRHGFKGAFEIAATVDFLYAFAATTGTVGDQLFEALYKAYVLDDRVRAFLAGANPGALVAIGERLEDAVRRGLWSPKSNSVHAMLDSLKERAA
jgi:cobaltochelatase CobN